MLICIINQMKRRGAVFISNGGEESVYPMTRCKRADCRRNVINGDDFLVSGLRARRLSPEDGGVLTAFEI